MGIRFNIFGKGPSKKSRAYFNTKMIRDAEIAREKAYCDAYMASRGF